MHMIGAMAHVHTSFRARKPSSQSVTEAATNNEAAQSADAGSENWNSHTTGGIAKSRSTVSAVGMDIKRGDLLPLLAGLTSRGAPVASFVSPFVAGGTSPLLDSPLIAFSGWPFELPLCRLWQCPRGPVKKSGLSIICRQLSDVFASVDAQKTVCATHAGSHVSAKTHKRTWQTTKCSPQSI